MTGLNENERELLTRYDKAIFDDVLQRECLRTQIRSLNGRIAANIARINALKRKEAAKR